MAKRIIVDIYELTEEYMKEHDLYHKFRVKEYVYDTKQLISHGVDKEYADSLKIGQIIEN